MKNRLINVIIPVFALLVLFGCSNIETVKDEGIRNVDIQSALDKKESAFLSEIASGEIEYVLLDSEKKYLLAQNPYFYLNGNEIIAFAKNQIYVFDRATGKFLREIGHYGKDPGGYKKVVQTFPFDEKRQLVYTSGWEPNSYFRYKTSGEFYDKVYSHQIEIEPDMMKNIFGEIVTSIAPLNDTCFVGYVWNINGKQEAKLIVSNENNHRIKTFSQYKRFDYDINRDGISVFSWNAKYYQLNNQLHFYERFTDTVFTVSVDTLLPRFILRQGQTETATATDFTEKKGEVPYSMIENIFETERYLCFKTSVRKKEFEAEMYYGVFDKKEGTTSVSFDEAGIRNDIDDFIALKFYSANANNEIIGALDAYEVKLWFEANSDKAAQLPPELQKLKSIKETDNPVVMIAKLKE